MSQENGNTKQFPLTNGQQVGSGYTFKNGKAMEPSGLAVMNNKLYMASDNGYLFSMDLSCNPLYDIPWTQVHNFSNDSDIDSSDLECITVISNQLMIGIEGSDSSHPRIFQYDPVSNVTGITWKIEGVNKFNLGTDGMEAMTFVPDYYCPNYGGHADYKGYFFVAYQNVTGKVYIYDLHKPTDNDKTQDVKNYLQQFSINDRNGNPITLKASDMCFASGYLFILFDGSSTGKDAKDEIHIFTLRADGNGLDHVGACYVPSIPNLWENQTDFEGLTIDVYNNNLYLSVDQSDKPKTKLVYQFTGFNINSFLDS